LLSRAETSISSGLSIARVEGTAPGQARLVSPESHDQHPLIETNAAASAKTTPPIYELYQGPKRPDLRVQGALGRLFYRRGFVFTGLTVGVINRSQSAFYVFGVNRGGASPPGPFPGRPNIFFDAEIIVATSPDGVSGTVELLNSQGQVTSTTSLANNAVSFFRNHVVVIMGAGLLPSTSPPGTARPFDRYSFSFWAGISPSIPKGIAGFAPGLANASVAAIGFPSS
jgi:hypothetical protein